MTNRDVERLAAELWMMRRLAWDDTLSSDELQRRARALLDAVFPVGEPDDERVVEKVEKALREAVIVEDGPGGERAMDFSLDRLARAAVAAVRAAGEEAE